MALPRVDTFVGVVIGAVVLFLLPAFYAYSPTSCTVKLQSVLVIAGLATHKFFPTAVKFAFDAAQSWAAANPLTTIGITFVAVSTLRYLQQKLRYARLNRLKMKHGFTEDPDTFTDMTVEQAQEVEANLAEWEFPRLWQFAWVSDFVRTATDPGVSRALVKSGHMVNPDPMVEHERLQATIHLMSCFLGYPIKSRNHSLAVARINEHHHRYGSMINSDDILYLIIHLGFNPVNWVNRFGYRQLNAFEVHANWVLWREIGVRMGCKYMPVTVEQALKWKKNFEKQRRWRDPANKVAGMAMFNEIIYSVPALLKELTRQVVASVLDRDIVYFCQLEDLQPSAVIRGVAFDLFSVCAWSIRNFGLPRLNRYQRVPEGPNEETGLMDFLHTPYDTLPFYQAQSFWNMWGYGALIRRLRGIPLPGLKYHPGSTIEAMGLAQISSVSQATVEKKVVEKASELMGAPYGYRPAIGYQYGRLLPPVDGPEYGSLLHTYTEKTPIIPMGEERFDKQFERRAPGYSNLTTIEKPRDITAFDSSEHYGGNVNGIQCDTVPAINSAV